MNSETLLKSIAEDRVHGSTELALIAIDGIRQLAAEHSAADSVRLRDNLFSLIPALQVCRPSMVALYNLMQQLSDRLELSTAAGSPIEFSSRVVTACREVVRQARDCQESVVSAMQQLIEPTDTIMTLSLSSTVKRLGSRLAGTGAGTRFIVTESRPGNEGRLLAEFLAQQGFPVTLITEAQINLFMPQVDKVVVGADAVLADGSAINKTGTTLMALSARYQGVPFYVCAESFKQRPDNRFELEEMNPEELGPKVPGVEIRNYYFERIPAELVTRWVN